MRRGERYTTGHGDGRFIPTLQVRTGDYTSSEHNDAVLGRFLVLSAQYSLLRKSVLIADVGGCDFRENLVKEAG